MAVKTVSTTLLGIEAVPIDVETEVLSGLRKFSIVGLPDGVVREAKDRVRCAVENSGFEFPVSDVVVSLAPAALPKIGSGFDVAIALSVLAAAGGIDPHSLRNLVFVGELALDGKLKEVGSELASAVLVKNSKEEKILVVSNSARNVLSRFEGLSVVYAESFLELVTMLKEGAISVETSGLHDTASEGDTVHNARFIEQVIQPSFKDVIGQYAAKRGLQIAAAGGHNMLMVGPPGGGKTMLAERVVSILPPLENEEFLEVNQIYSALKSQGIPDSKTRDIIQTRPFRAPHHTSSLAGLIGGGSVPMPGEVTLSHKGILFLDEFPELRRDALESLREPLESGKISISRAKVRLSYPCDFILIAAMNPCPCGQRGLTKAGHTAFKSLCECPPQRIQKYFKKISGPILDRLDIQLWIPQVPIKELREGVAEDITEKLKQGVIAARALQFERFGNRSKLNAAMKSEEVRTYCVLDVESENLIDAASSKFSLSARAYTRILKLARTIADIESSENIQLSHMAEAISYRVNLSSQFS